MRSEDEDLEALLESVANHGRVDWQRAEAEARSPEQQARLRGLRDVARVVDFHHSLQSNTAAETERREVEAWGELLLLERVGSGASGDVYRAWDPTLQREVALKILRTVGGTPGGTWLEEARALARVRDPHVVSVFGAAEHGGRAGLWMEFLRGATLEYVLGRGALDPAEVARIGAQLARALAAVHAAGALHRDLKPANVVVTTEGGAVLTDFGLGRRASSEHDAEPFSGTPLFMSPQRLAGAEAKATDDVYALGVTLWWALAGKPPFDARNLDELRAAAAAGPARPLSAVRPEAPAVLAAAIERAMLPDPARRFANAAELAAALEAVRPQSPARAAPTSSRWAWVALALVVGVLVTWLALTRTARRSAPPGSAPAPAADSYDVSANFMRRASGGDQRLDTGDRVAPGDRVSLAFRSTRPAWVYVLDADERGECYLLFPQPLFDRRNPVPSDVSVMLPGTRGGSEVAWTVTSRGGREHLLVVASPQPVADLEAELSRLPAPVPGHPIRYARVGAGTMGRLRGMGGVGEVPESHSPAGPADVFERIRALAGAEQGVRGIWVRQVTLENPLR